MGAFNGRESIANGESRFLLTTNARVERSLEGMITRERFTSCFDYHVGIVSIECTACNGCI